MNRIVSESRTAAVENEKISLRLDKLARVDTVYLHAAVVGYRYLVFGSRAYYSTGSFTGYGYVYSSLGDVEVSARKSDHLDQVAVSSGLNTVELFLGLVREVVRRESLAVDFVNLTVKSLGKPRYLSPEIARILRTLPSSETENSSDTPSITLTFAPSAIPASFSFSTVV